MSRLEDDLPQGEQFAEYLNGLIQSGRMTNRFQAKAVIEELERDFLMGQFSRLFIDEDTEKVIPGYMVDKADVLKITFPGWKNMLIESFKKNDMGYEPEVFEEFESVNLESLIAVARADAKEWEKGLNQVQEDVRAMETFGRNVEYWKRIVLILEIATKE